MAKKTNEILALLKRISGEESSLNMLMELEKTFDNAHLYAYRNWMNGELVEGPTIDRYWFTTTWMYPYKMMPDPDGSLRLIKYGCKIYYKKDTLLEPSRVLSGDDLKGGTGDEMKRAKILKKSVWLITIKMPRKFVDEAQEGMLEFESGEVDIEDINQAWDENLGDNSSSREQEVSAETDAREEEFAGEIGEEI